MLVDDSVIGAYLKSLNAWHLEFAITTSALKNVSLSHQVDQLGRAIS